MKKVLAIFLATLFIFTAVPFSTVGAQEETTVQYGLTVADDGTILLAGKPFYAFGENNYGTYARWTEDYTKDWFRESIPLFKEYNIPFIRCSFSGYSPSYYQDFDQNPEKYLKMMDEVIKCAEENQLGLILSLMWNQIALPSAFGEKMASLGDPNSKSVAFAKKYVTTIVERYKDSPAVWGWEIGNEYNLSADLCDPNLKEWAPQHYVVGEVNGFDYVTSAEVTYFYEEIAKAIRGIDDYRLISNGNGEMRSFAYASRMNSEYFMDEETHTWTVNWSQNSREEFYEMCDYFTPDPMDTLSFHFQHATLGSSDPQYILDFNLFYEGTLSLTEYLEAYVQAARRLGKAAYFGEFGDMLDMDTAPDRAAKFQYVMDCIRDAGVQIASAWHYQDVTTEGFHGENLEMIGEMNREYQKRGVQDLDAYWNNVVDTDMPSDWALTETYSAAAVGLVPTHINSNYTADITRADFCDLIINMIEKKLEKSIDDVVASYNGAKTDVSFPDTDSANVIAAAMLGIVNGRSSGAFDPTANITRQEAAKMLALAAKVLGADITASEVAFADADSIYEWAKEFIYYVNTIGVMNGTSTTTPPNFSPLRTYTREQSILTVYRLFNAI